MFFIHHDKICYIAWTFLSDVRLGKKLTEISLHFSKMYKCLFNSTSSKRGVGILYKKDLDLEVIDILLIKCRYCSTDIVLGSIYGPNVDDNREFLNNIDRNLGTWNGIPIIIGGDWNVCQLILIRTFSG